MIFPNDGKSLPVPPSGNIPFIEGDEWAQGYFYDYRYSHLSFEHKRGKQVRLSKHYSRNRVGCIFGKINKKST